MTARRDVLVVDDVPDICEALSLLLGLLGHHVRVAGSGVEALQRAREALPEIVLLDVGLPDRSGYDVARELRSWPGGDRIFLAAITGWGAVKDRVDSLAAGFDLHIAKPVDATSLANILAIAADVLRARS